LRQTELAHQVLKTAQNEIKLSLRVSLPKATALKAEKLKFDDNRITTSNP
jgi:hypothetical protein